MDTDRQRARLIAEEVSKMFSGKTDSTDDNPSPQGDDDKPPPALPPGLISQWPGAKT